MITFGIDGGACQTALPGNHPAARGYKVHCDGQYGAEYDTASNKNIWSKGEIILYATCSRHATGTEHTESSMQKAMAFDGRHD